MFGQRLPPRSHLLLIFTAKFSQIRFLNVKLRYFDVFFLDVVVELRSLWHISKRSERVFKSLTCWFTFLIIALSKITCLAQMTKELMNYATLAV